MINKKITTLSLILVLAMTTLIGGISIANAQAPRKQTYAFLGLIPDKVGVGQEVLIHIGIFTATANVNYGWKDLTVTITRPDGTKQTLGPYKTDSTGGTGATFVPNQVGTYYIQSHFPEQENLIGFFEFERGTFLAEGTIMEASNSAEIPLVVQENPIDYYPSVPLPTEFWSRPVDAQFWDWQGITGNWLRTPMNVFAPYNDGPESAHILWAKPLTAGGLAGGERGANQMEDGDAYEGKYQNSVIINGRLYYNRFGSTFTGAMTVQDGIVAVDLRTGEELWFRNNTSLSFGQTFFFDAFNYHGVYDYLWETQGSTWNAYDPFNGEWVYSMTDVPSGNQYTGSNGEFLIVVTDLENGWMALWNQTVVGQQDITITGDLGSWGRFVHKNTWDASNGYSWNVTIPTDLSANLGGLFSPMPTVVDDRLLGVDITPARDEVTVWALSLKPGQEGQLLYKKTWSPPSEWETGMHVIHYTGSTNNAEGGVFCLWSKELRKHYGFSLDTGEYLWETESQSYLEIYGFGSGEHSWFFAYNKLYSTGVSGILYCYDLDSGATLWTYVAEDTYSEYLFGSAWWGRIPFITDGKVYMGHTEHSAMDPKPRGAPFTCLDAETGEVIWQSEGLFRQTHWGGRGIIGDSIIATMDTYDQRIYAIGKGPTATTVSASPKVSVQGSSVLIEGIVTDISAGTQDPALTARFPSGVAAVSDESMSEWMAYVYKQFPRPSATGVPVTIDVIDSNGNYRNIGTATSDSSGFYSFQWTPDISGKYTVIAMFAGSKAYYASYSETAFGVDEAPEPTPEPTPTPAPMTDTYLTGSTIAILAGIAIAVFLLLRKK